MECMLYRMYTLVVCTIMKPGLHASYDYAFNMTLCNFRKISRRPGIELFEREHGPLIWRSTLLTIFGNSARPQVVVDVTTFSLVTLSQ